MEVEANYAIAEDSTTMSAKKRSISDKWIVDSGGANQITGDVKKLFHKMEYNGSRMVVTTESTRLPIKWIGDTVFVPRRNPHKV